MTDDPRAPLQPAYLWAGVAGLAVLCTAIVALYGLAPAHDKPNIAPVFAALVTGIPTLMFAAAAWLRGRSTHQLAVTNAAKLDDVREQTDGHLDERIKNAITEVLDEQPHLIAKDLLTRQLKAMLEGHLDEPQSPPTARRTPAPRKSAQRPNHPPKRGKP